MPPPRPSSLASGRGRTERYFEDIARWLSAKPGEPPEWQDASIFGDSLLYVTADELVAIKGELSAIVDRYLERSMDRALRPPGARPVTFLHFAFPEQGPQRGDG